MEAKKEDLKKLTHVTDKKRRTYAAMVHCLDYGTKRVLASLKSTGVYENTLIIFLSDNAGALNLGATNTPLNGGKRGSNIQQDRHQQGRIISGAEKKAYRSKK